VLQHVTFDSLKGMA